MMTMMGRAGAWHDKMADRFAAMDTDGDGAVSAAEFLADGEARFKEADANGDGTVTVWEYYAQRAAR
jgi:hypothetical protein